jgi:hypothetical protein
MINDEKLRDAARALERASVAASLAQMTRPNSLFPCKAQLAAAKAEIECAVQLIKEAQDHAE